MHFKLFLNGIHSNESGNEDKTISWWTNKSKVFSSYIYISKFEKSSCAVPHTIKESVGWIVKSSCSSSLISSKWSGRLFITFLFSPFSSTSISSSSLLLIFVFDSSLV